ncbi:hypothetical protein QVD99_003187 [Batrachochytrium dendrobatidis]|nr:hypothetical protein QVD99_003187 [Batrachochytrium dendrobatidis]
MQLVCIVCIVCIYMYGLITRIYILDIHTDTTIRSTTTITIRLYVDHVVMSSDWIQLQCIYESYNELLNKLLNESYKVRVRVRVMQYNTMCTSIQNTSQP